MNLQRRIILISGLFLAVAVAFAFLPSLHNGFVNWDDPIYLEENIRIRDLSLSGIVGLFTTLHYHTYKPLTELTFALEYRFFGLNPFVYHLNNLILHLFNCLLVFWLAYLLSRSNIAVALIAAVLFGIHPLRVESVVWVTERKDVLYGFFFLGSTISYLYYLAAPSRKRYCLTLLLFVVSLLPKGQGMFLPCLLLLFDWYRGRRIGGRVLLEKVPFLLVLALFFYLNFSGQAAAGNFHRAAFLAAFSNLPFTFYGLLFYPVRLALPVRLSAFYPLPETPLRLVPSLFTLAPAIIASLAAAAVYSARRNRAIIFAVLFFFINIAIVIQVVRIGPTLVADRYSYISTIGFCYLAGAAAVGLWKRYRRRRRRGILILAGLVVFFSLLILTRRQCLVWRDSVTLWDDVLAKNYRHPTIYLHRGMALQSEGRMKEAEASYRAALRLHPGFYQAFNNLGNLQKEEGRTEEAIVSYREALRWKPDSPDVYNNLGGIWLEQGRLDAAVACFQAAIDLKPDYPAAYNNLGLARAAAGRWEEARENYLSALRLRPDYLESHRNLAAAFLRTGNFAGAVYHAGEFVRYRPGDAEARNLLGVAHSRGGESAAAAAQYFEALRLRPDFPAVRNNLGIELSRQGRSAEAIEHFREAIRLQPDYPEAWNNLGVDLVVLERYAEAIVAHRKSLELWPDYPDGQYNLGLALDGQGRWEEAAFHYRETLRLDPGYAGARLRLEELAGPAGE